MVSIDEAARVAMELPGVTEGIRFGNHAWLVDDRSVAWEPPFSKADLKRFGGETPPAGPIIAVRVEDRGEKGAVPTRPALPGWGGPVR